MMAVRAQRLRYLHPSMPDIEMSSRNRSGPAVLGQCAIQAGPSGALRRMKPSGGNTSAQQIALHGIVVGDQDRLARAR